MNVAPIGPLDGRGSGTAQLVLFQGDADFVARLTIGQILKGRVLLSYDQRRHAVEFDGQPRVVDSSVPLKAGEVLHGRVVGLGEQVTLQRLPAPDEAAADRTLRAPSRDADAPEAGVPGWLQQLQERLTPSQLKAMQRLVERAPSRPAGVAAGLVMAQLGLPASADLHRALHAAIARPADEPLFALPHAVDALQLASARQPSPLEAVPALAGWLQAATAEVPEPKLAVAGDGPGADTDGDDARDGGATAGDGGDLARWMLNAQTGGSVAHRVATLPLLLDGELLELDIALFAQHDDGPPAGPGGELKHRELVFALTTEVLGRVEVRARLTGDHVQVEMTSDRADAVDRLAGRAATLEAALERAGLAVDEQRYLRRTHGAGGAVVASVVEHLVTPGSLSRLA